ncbi:Uncharacterised protein [Mycobacterium tuberculosis]|nr:Uncharacterised protein [Mycobacterium tuberculosis]CPA19103.1 Uncharacterised protein [Mycobacterium tuberculosis]
MLHSPLTASNRRPAPAIPNRMSRSNGSIREDANIA